MAMRDDLRQWVDEIPDAELGVVWRMLKGLRSTPVAPTSSPAQSDWLANAPVDDEPLSVGDRAALTEAEASIAAGQVTLVSVEEMRRRILG